MCQRAFERVLRDLTAEQTPKDESLVFLAICIVYLTKISTSLRCRFVRGGEPDAPTIITKGVSNGSQEQQNTPRILDRPDSLVTRPLELSLRDRYCLVLGMAEKLSILTADREWAKLQIGVRIQVIR
jgi:hypothetical protein